MPLYPEHLFPAKWEKTHFSHSRTCIWGGGGHIIIKYILPAKSVPSYYYEVVVATSAIICKKGFAPHTGARAIPPTLLDTGLTHDCHPEHTRSPSNLRLGKPARKHHSLLNTQCFGEFTPHQLSLSNLPQPTQAQLMRGEFPETLCIEQGVVLSCRFAESKVRWTSCVLWMAVVSQSSVK